MVCEGLRCYVRSKSALLTGVWNLQRVRGMLIQAMMEADHAERVFESILRWAVLLKAAQILWDQKQKEHV